MTGGFLHGLGAWPAALVLVCCLASAGTTAFRERAQRKRVALLGEPRPPGRPLGPVPAVRFTALTEALRVRLPAIGVGLAGVLLIGGVPGCVTGVGAAVAVSRWRASRPTGRDGPSEEEMARRLPLAADLLAACLEAGAGPCEAAEAVGASLGGPVGRRLRHVAAELRMGQEPAAAWDRLGRLPGARGLARCLERAQTSGAPAAASMARLAVARRTEETRAAAARARRAGVLATAPLGLCFLPAFLVIGVAPVLIGLAGELRWAG